MNEACPHCGTRLRRLAALEEEWAKPRPEYDHEAYQREGHDYARRYGDAHRAWHASMRRALSLGKLTGDDARGRGYYNGGQDHTGWKPLPRTLYHVTTAADEVGKHGLKTRAELGQVFGKGLGGGEDDTISFTTDADVAHNIADRLREMHLVSTGQKATGDMVSEARDGLHARHPFLVPVARSYDPYYRDGDPLPDRLQDRIDGMHTQRGLATQAEVDSGKTRFGDIFEGHGWEPHPHAHRLEAKGESAYNRWHRPMTRDEQRQADVDHYKYHATHREGAGGPENPLFFNTDHKALSEMDPDQFRVLTFHPKPGAQGYSLGGMSEWRTASGDAVEPESHKTAGYAEPASDTPEFPRPEQVFPEHYLYQPQHKQAAKKWLGQTSSWDEVARRHRGVYGNEDPADDYDEDTGEGEEDPYGHGGAAVELAYDRPEEKFATSGGNHYLDDLDFHHEKVYPRHIDYAPHEPGDPRLSRSRQGYMKDPTKMPPLLLVHRHGVYQVADGSHRAEAAHQLDKPVRAYVHYSEHESEPFSDRPPGGSDRPGAFGPFFNAKPDRKAKMARHGSTEVDLPGAQRALRDAVRGANGLSGKERYDPARADSAHQHPDVGQHLRSRGIHADFGAGDATTARLHDATFATLADRYPGLLHEVDTSDAPMSEEGAHATPGKITFSERAMRHPETMENFGVAGYLGGHLAAPGAHGVAAHEFGHVLGYHVGLGNIGLYDLARKLHPRAQSSGRAFELARKKMSGYAQKGGPDELVAEAFADREANGDKAAPYSRAIAERMDHLYHHGPEQKEEPEYNRFGFRDPRYRGKTAAGPSPESGWNFEHYHLEGRNHRLFGTEPGGPQREHMLGYRLTPENRIAPDERDLDRVSEHARAPLLDAAMAQHGATELHGPEHEAPSEPESSDPPAYYHGTTAARVRTILPAARHQRFVSFPHVTDPHHAYATTNLDSAWDYAEKAWHNGGQGRPRVYRVEPLGEVEADPEIDEKGVRRGNKVDDVRSKHGFRVVDRMPPPPHIAETTGEDWR
jgi:hypothetical protein